ALDATAGGKINLNAGTIATSGDQIYRTDAQLLADNGLTAGGAIDFLGAVGGNSKLTTNSTGDTTFGGVVGIGALDATAAHINLKNGAVTTAQDQSYTGAVVLGADNALTSTAGNIALNGAVSGADKLTTSSALDTTFGGAVNVAAVDATAAHINLDGGAVTTAQAQSHTGAAVLGGDTALTSTAGNIALIGTVGGVGKLTTNSALDTTFGGAVNIGSLDATAAGNINVNGGSIGTVGDQSYHSNVALGGDTSLTSSAGSIGFDTALTSAHGLTTDSSVDTTFLDAVSLGALNATAGGNINLSNGSVLTSGDQIYNGVVALGADAGLTSLTGGIGLLGGVSGAGRALTTNSGVDTTLGGAVNVASLDASAGGRIALNGPTIQTSGDQAYHAPVLLGGDAALTSAAGAV